MRVLPPIYVSDPLPGATISLPAVGTAELAITNQLAVPNLDDRAWPLTLSFAGLSGGIGIGAATALDPGKSNTFTIACNNTTAQAITQTLQVSQNGIAPGPVGVVEYSVTCAGVPVNP